MNILQEQIDELRKLPQPQPGLVDMYDVEQLLHDFDNKWFTSCQNEMNKLSMGLEVEDPFNVFK